MRYKATWMLLVCALTAVFAWNGPAPLGRLAYTLGLYRLAGAFTDDPVWRGATLYRSGAFEAAAEAFRQAGPNASFNRGNALAFAGQYNAAVAAYDAVLFRQPEHAAAQANRALIAPLASVVIGESGPGLPMPADTVDGKGRSVEGPPAIRSTRHEDIVEVLRQLYKGKDFTGKSVVASQQWLATLPDEPGRYLKRRIAAERAQRLARGQPVTSGDDPW